MTSRQSNRENITEHDAWQNYFELISMKKDWGLKHTTRFPKHLIKTVIIIRNCGATLKLKPPNCTEIWFFFTKNICIIAMQTDVCYYETKGNYNCPAKGQKCYLFSTSDMKSWSAHVLCSLKQSLSYTHLVTGNLTLSLHQHKQRKQTQLKSKSNPKMRKWPFIILQAWGLQSVFCK